MVSLKELEKYSTNISIERLSVFVYDNNDIIDDVLKRYENNIKISQAFYPELSVLEVSLRNAIDTIFKEKFGNDWIEQEVKYNYFLDSFDYDTLLKAYNDVKRECQKTSKKFTAGKVIANLSFGFWTNICLSKYNAKIWTKKGFFKGVFVNFPKNKQQQIHSISNTLNSIRKLRNRVFHYERILKKPSNLLIKFNEIMEILNYLPHSQTNILTNTSDFLTVYNEITAQSKAKT